MLIQCFFIHAARQCPPLLVLLGLSLAVVYIPCIAFHVCCHCCRCSCVRDLLTLGTTTANYFATVGVSSCQALADVVLKVRRSHCTLSGRANMCVHWHPGTHMYTQAHTCTPRHTHVHTYGGVCTPSPLLQAGQRAVIGKVCQDRLAPPDCCDHDADVAIAGAVEVADYVSVRPAVGRRRHHVHGPSLRCN